MGKKRGGDKNSGLGKTILKERSRGKRTKGQSWLHSADVGDGYDWGRLNLRSVTEESRLDDFLHTAELAGTEFTAEKLNIRVVEPSTHTGLPSLEERGEIERMQAANRQYLAIPRRPPWDSTMSADQLDVCERESFLEWRRELARLEEGDERLVITPFEKNLQFWRQLWRVVERSDVIVQIVDGRNPLLFRCEDLEKYVREVDSHKVNMLLVNKADLLTQKQREVWAEYFAKSGDITVVFWSATAESGQEKKEEEEEEEEEEDMDGEEEEKEEEEEEEEGGGEEMEVVEEGAESLPSLLHVSQTNRVYETPEQLCVARGNQQNIKERRDLCAENPEESPRNEDGDHEMDDSNLGAKTIVSHEGDTTETVSHGEDPADNFTNEGHISDEENPADNFTKEEGKYLIDEEDPADCSTNERGECHGDAPTESSANKGSPAQTGHVHVPSGKASYNLGTGKESRSLESGGGVGKGGVGSSRGFPGVSPTSARAKLLSREELVDLFLEISPVKDGGLTTVGLVGYPNVGKSSTINALFQGKKVPVSATPGRTKHFQTLYISDTLMLCDCPGLVFPTFVTTKAELVCNGILPIDQMRDHIPPTSLVCQNIPRATLEQVCHLRLSRPREGEDPDRLPTAHELLSTYGYMRGFMTQHGLPDCPRSARYILKDYVSGKLLYCHPPPGVDPHEFNHFPKAGTVPCETDSLAPEGAEKETQGGRTEKVAAAQASEFDQFYFRQERVRAIKKGVHGPRGPAPLHKHDSETAGVQLESDTASVMSKEVRGGKPWRKHHNQHKREKTRRTAKLKDSLYQ